VHNTQIVTTVAILGSAGYTGQHALDPRLNGPIPMFTSNLEAGRSGAEAIFLCLGNEQAAAFEPPAGAIVIDLGGVHRLVDHALAQKWYGLAPGAWSYGLPEVHPAEGPLIANPGCYATATLLALWPLRDATEGDIVVDAKSGMTGAGKTLRDSSHAGAVLENFSPYAVGGHRHAPEISQVLGLPITFVPHLLPVRRGLLATCYVRSSADVRALVEDAYSGSAVVRVLPEGIEPEIARVQGTDSAEIGVFTDGATGMWIVICAIDNLGKGAAGQAVQNLNLALGLRETTGLRLGSVLV
jgi:N-acetyl-gamma-glutamyl-phosphate reductase